MPSVDNRVVKMEFDNASFERGVSTTLGSIKTLNKALQFTGVGKGLGDISAAASKVNLGGISEGIEGVSKKFLALSTVAITALANITTAALRAGVNFVKSFTFTPVMDGFKEFELNMNSIQTILANTKSKGTTLEQVNTALDQMNEYSDKTIYNFGQMARNVGTFTAAGVDLDTSVRSIKGIANLAAISGSNSEQASTAMYQLSQAISTGTVKLMDWNSVVNAGMGGEVFQKALFESGKAMGTLADVPMDQTFDQWTDAGNSFRGSLESGWLTGDVLTTTLQSIAGEMTEGELIAKGFSAEVAKSMVELGKTGVDAATKVRTLTGLLGTVKESISSGWSASFRLLVGGFEESTQLFTGLSNAITGFIGKSADARNKWLQQWANLGGRMLAIEAIRLAFKRLGEILKPLTDAFRKVFPPVTAERIVAIQWAIVNFLNGISPAKSTIDGLKVVFEGFFSILKIGWNVLKEGVKFIGKFIGVLASMGGDADILGFFVKIGDFFRDLSKNLVEGSGITDFFDRLYESVQKIPAIFDSVKDAVMGFFDSLTSSNAVEEVGDSVEKVGDRFGRFGDAFSRIGDIWAPFATAMDKVFEILDKVWEGISTWFSDLGKRIADTMSEGDFDAALDILNVALLGGITAILAKFLKDGFKFDIGGGLLKKVTDVFEKLTGVLEAMQLKLKADALLRIAGAIAILTASVLVLSLIDSAALTKALSAMAIGFGQLMGAFAILSKLSIGPTSAASFAILAVGMTILAGAILLLAFSVKVLGTMDWDELAKGLIGVTVLLAAISLAAKPLSANAEHILAAGIAMIPLAIALLILSKAVALFAEMEFGELIKGLFGMIVAITGLGLAMRAFPENLAVSGLGLLLIANSLKKIADAVETFASFEWGVILKGIFGMALALAAIGLAMQLFPTNMPLTALGLLLVSVALIGIQKAMAAFGGMSIGEIVKGIYGMGGALVVLAAAMLVMSGSVAGAIALGIAAISLGILFKVLEQFANIKFGDLIKGLAAMAIALAVIAGAAYLLGPAIPFMIALGVALILIGAGFALFGVGAAAVAKSFELFAKVGPKGAKAFVEAMKTMIKIIPELVGALAEGVVEFFATLATLAPKLAESAGIILAALMDQLTLLIPSLVDLLVALLTGVIDILRAMIPQYALLGVDLILGFLQGIRDRIGDVVTVVAEIITEFLGALTEQIPKVVTAGTDLFVTMITSIAEAIGRMGATLFFGIGISLVTGFIDGLRDQVGRVWSWVTEFVGSLIDKIKSALGISSPSTVFLNIGIDIITGLYNGIVDAAVKVKDWFLAIGKNIVSWVGSLLTTLRDKGYQVITGFWNGLQDRWTGVVNWFKDIPDKIVDAIGDVKDLLEDVGRWIIEGLKRGMENAWKGVTGWFSDRMEELKSIPGVSLILGSPSKVTTDMGGWIMEGFLIGMKREWKPIEAWLTRLDIASHIDAERMNSNFQKVLDAAALSIADMDSAKPVITPVLDLSEIAAGAGQISSLLGSAVLAPSGVSTARQISLATTSTPADDVPVSTVPGDVVFTQTINAPTKLSTADIYKQTRNQIAIAKEELKIS